MKKLLRFYNTIKYLKIKQFTYRAFYFLRNKIRKLTRYKYPTLVAPPSKPLKLIEHQNFHIYTNLYKNSKFTFIGITYEFQDSIDWNYSDHGKLWNYNLNYFDFLQQEEINRKDGLRLIQDFIDYPHTIIGKSLPFPISLRNVNFIKFISRENIEDTKINSFIFNKYLILLDNLEYHLLGNHLLENGFSLLFGAYYFEDEKLYNKAFEISTEELTEQILNDGAHFELSPMYHQIMLFRVLDCINLVKNNQWKNQELLKLLTQKAQLMLGWLRTITYENGDIPLFNDSAKGIAPTSKELFSYADILDIKAKQIKLSDSGYRKEKNENYESVVDVGKIGPDYIPGHAHSDTFNFELYINKQPVIVDTGISTYETNEQRTLERSTSSHNTVEIDGENQTDVWGGFRVGRRAKVIKLEENSHYIKAVHDGYKHKDLLHQREWNFLKNRIKIVDTIKGEKSNNNISYLHFHPDINIKIKDNSIITSLIKISFKDIDKLSINRYNYSNNFNSKKISNVIIIFFKKKMSMEINIL